MRAPQWSRNDAGGGLRQINDLRNDVRLQPPWVRRINFARTDPTHLEVSCRNPFDSYGEEYDRAADKYFRSSCRPTMQETIDFYREKKIGFVNFTVDAEMQMGRRRIPNEEIAEAALTGPDGVGLMLMLAFAAQLLLHRFGRSAVPVPA